MYEKFRGNGFGKAAIVALEQELPKIGVTQIKLRVAFDNPRALGLYEKLGFMVTGHNLSKNL